MADKEAKKVEQDAPTAHAKVTNAEGTRSLDDRNRQVWIIWVVIVGFVVLILLVVAAMVVAHGVRDNLVGQRQPRYQMTSRGGYGGYPNGSFYSQTSNSDGLTTTTTTTRYTYTTGVVTKVNNDSIVVAGNGKAQTIATNSSTTYDNGTKPAVNDTVQVIGTADSSGNITATEVQVLN